MSSFTPLMRDRVYTKSREVFANLGSVHAALSGITDEENTSPSTAREYITHLSQNDPALFAKRYLFKNIVKCVAAAVRCERIIKNRSVITDLGSGSGAFIYAVDSVFRSKHITAVDRNAAALHLSRRFFDLSGRRVPTMIVGDVANEIISLSGIVTLSYLLVELEANELISFSRLIRQSRGLELLVVDYPQIVGDLVHFVGPSRVSFAETVSITLPADLAAVVGDQRISMGICHVSV